VSTVGVAHVSFGSAGQPSLVDPSQSSSQEFPHASAGAQHGAQVQVGLQAWVPATPQALVHDSVAPAEHAPPPVQAVQEVQAQVAPQLRVSVPVPQKPQVRDSVAPLQQA
jgi:hypothetical protein